MADPLSPNKFLPQPILGSDTDNWTAPYNAVTGTIDAALGGVATIALTSSPVVLSSGQYQNVFLNFTGALNANVAVTLPAVGSFYTIINDTTNSSTFVVTLLTTAAGGAQVGVPPATTDIMTDGVNVRFRNLPHPGSYWHYSGSSTPAWVSACSTPPWLYCNGTTFSSGTYPLLTVILNSTTLPDLRGRTAYYYEDGTGRLGGIGTLGAAGGAQTITLTQANLPNVSFPVTDPGHNHTVATNDANAGSATTAGGPATGGYLNGATVTINSAVTGISVNSGGSGTAFAILPPGVVAGISMIRAA